MKPSSPAGRSARRWRGFAAVLALLAATTAGTVAAPSPAAANDPPFIIPPNGWCYSSWYNVSSVQGTPFLRYGNRKFLENNSSVPVTWNESLSVSTTFTSTWSTTTTFSGGVDFGVIRIGVQSSTTHTVTRSISVSTTSGFSVTVPAFTTMYAEYGVYRVQTTGTYVESKHECQTWNYETVTSGSLTAYSVIDNSEGWRIWEN
jgi:hypothetical protein